MPFDETAGRSDSGPAGGEFGPWWGGVQMVVHMTLRGEPRFVEEALFVRGYSANKTF